MNITKLVTHSGSFHADDVLATVILTHLFPDAELIRTRDEHFLQNPGSTSLVYDVGMVYDSEKNRFDHHQKDRANRPELIENLEIPYSSLGLIWKHFGKAYLKSVFDVPEKDLHSIHTGVDRRFIIKVDMGDNGVVPPSEAGISHPLSFTRLIEVLSPDFDNKSETTEMEAFLQAVDVSSHIFKAKVRSIIAAKRSDKIGRKAVKNRTDPQWVEFPQGMSYLNALKAEKADTVLFVIMPGKTDDEWQMSAVRSSSSEFGCKKPFPEHWAGLRNQDLEEASGVKDAMFCHLGRHLVFSKSKESIFKLLELALQN